MKIIITRPQEDAGPLSEKMIALGHQPLVLPLLKIVARSNVQIPYRPYQAICLTSANAVRVLTDVTSIKTIPLLAVGPQSLLTALEKGFAEADAHGGDVIGLHSYIVEHLQSKNGPLLYLSGSETSGDLEGHLSQSGFEVDRVITYDAVSSTLAGHEAEIKTANAVVLYSPRSAKLWVQQIENLKLGTAAQAINHLCLSPNIAANLPQSWPRAIAAAPNEASLLALLD